MSKASESSLSLHPVQLDLALRSPSTKKGPTGMCRPNPKSRCVQGGTVAQSHSTVKQGVEVAASHLESNVPHTELGKSAGHPEDAVLNHVDQSARNPVQIPRDIYDSYLGTPDLTAGDVDNTDLGAIDILGNVDNPNLHTGYLGSGVEYPCGHRSAVRYSSPSCALRSPGSWSSALRAEPARGSRQYPFAPPLPGFP